MIRKISLLLAGALMGASAMSLVYGVPGSAANAAGSETYKQLAIFGDIFERVRNQYVTPPDEKSLVENAINGMLASLDPHSSYLNPEAAKDMAQEPQMPSRQERRSVSVGSILFLIHKSASRTIGPQSSMSTK